MPELGLRPCFKVIEGGGAYPTTPPPGNIRPERLAAVDDVAILTLMAKGRLPPDGANDHMAAQRPVGRWSLMRVAGGAVVWGFALAGLWSIVN